MDGVFGGGEPVVRELPLASHLDEAHATQIGQMTRHRRLWQSEDVHHIADAELSGGEDAQDADARRISEALEDGVEILDRRFDRHGGRHGTG